MRLPVKPLKATHKFKAQRCESDNIKFDSKIERKYYEQLKILKKSGHVIGFLRQVPFHFKCGSKYVLDFLVFYSDGSCKAIEVKGVETPVWKIKKKLLDDEYPWLEIEIVKK